MTLQKVTIALVLSAFMLFGAACKSSFVVKDVDYSQRIESVLTPDENGVVYDVRHGLRFNVLAFQHQEFGDTSSIDIEEIRLIRNANGFYFITAQNFNHVYVMEPEAGSLKLVKRIKVAEDGLKSPAFNLRDNIVELVELESSEVFALNADGIKERRGGQQS